MSSLRLFVSFPEELVDRPRGMSYLVVQGRRGGSAMAAAAVNAIANNIE